MRSPLFAALLVLAAAAPAAADPGVHVDPDSPAGKEYGLPLEDARRNATGESGGSAPEPGSVPEPQPLFGAGVERAKRPQRGRERSGTDGDEKPSQRTASVGAPVEGDGSSTLTGGAIVLGLLVAGGLGALALRRGLGRES